MATPVAPGLLKIGQPGGADRRTSGRPGAPELTARLLGTFRATVDGVPVDTALRRRPRELLAYLLTHRRYPAPRDVMMEAFWPAAPPAAARNRLHVALSGVRQALRAASPYPFIERRFDTYRIADSVAVWTDLEQFEQTCNDGQLAHRAGDHDAAIRCFEAASQLYESDFLADEPYLEWAATRRESLRMQAVEIQDALMTCYLARGDHGPATILGRQILTMDPCNEQVHRRLMTCYAATGQRHLALWQYHRLATTLWKTFRVTPSAETLHLYGVLRRQRAHQTRSA